MSKHAGSRVPARDSAERTCLHGTPGEGRAREYVCLICGAPMLDRACKLRCGRCGYFEDCSNGLTPPPVQRRQQTL